MRLMNMHVLQILMYEGCLKSVQHAVMRLCMQGFSDKVNLLNVTTDLDQFCGYLK